MPAAVSSSVQSFSQGWLGQFSSDPTLDGYGNAVIAGAQYYNNALNVIRIYSGTSWSNYNPGDASAAANSANLAQAYATQAGNAATNAASSAASAAASLASIGTAVTQAQNSATASATSATASAGSAATAVTSATAAGASATAAANSATTASSASTSASTSATNASNSATSAATSATSAANNATNASNSATNSLNSATASATSATAAAGSASSASTSASSAATSATNAGNSATAAAASAAQAAGVVGGIITIPLTNSNITLNATQFSNAIIVFTGSITANIVVTVPATSHVFIAENNTTGAFTVTLGMTGGSATVNVPQSKANSLFCDGATGVYATSSVAGLQFSGTNQVTVSGTTLTSTNAGTRTVLATGSMTTTLPAGSTLQSGAAVYLDNQTSSTNTIQVNGSDPIDIGSPFTMNPRDKFLMSWDGTTWRTALYSNYLSPVFQNSVSVATGGFTATNTTNGIGLAINGTGGITPLKSIASVAGSLTVLSNSNSTILTLTDAGKLTVPNLDGTVIGANTPAAATITTASVTSGTNSTVYTTGALTVTGGVGIGGNVFTNGNVNANGEYITFLTSPATQTGHIYYNSAATTNNASLVNLISSTTAIVGAQTNGSGTAVPLTFQMNGSEFGRLSTGGRWLFNTTTDDGTSIVQINGQLHLTQAGAGGGIEFGDGTIQTTANGTTAPVSTVYTPATGATQITTGGYTPGFIQVYQNGVRLVNGAGQDYTATDSVHINLTHAAGAGDTYEVLTAVIYSPQTIATPLDVVYTPAAGTTTFTVTTYTVGYVDVFLNGSKLVGGQDYSATTGNSITLIGFTANGTDQFDVKVWTLYTPANAIPAANTTFSGLGRLQNVQTFSTVGTFTYTPTAGTNCVIVKIVGGGGGGAGAVATSTQSSMGGGGQSGVYAEAFITSGFSGVTVTVGAGATASAVGAAGNNGSTSSFGSLVSCPGGLGGPVSVAVAASSVASFATQTTFTTATLTGAGTTSLVNLANDTPASGIFYAGSGAIAGAGGNNPLGKGGIAINSVASTSGNPGQGFGSGGSGAMNFNNTHAAVAGSTGAQGVVIVYEYS
jgi:hypothetical protein